MRGDASAGVAEARVMLVARLGHISPKPISSLETARCGADFFFFFNFFFLLSPGCMYWALRTGRVMEGHGGP